jgi:hypothetical protein
MRVFFALERAVQREKGTFDCLTEQHLRLFGSIIQWFARYELVMQDVMATVSGSDSASLMLLTRGLDFGGKRRAMLDLLRHRAVPLDQFDRVLGYLTVPDTLASLRNNIAHSAWIVAPASGGIQPDWILRLPPSIKPWHDAHGTPSDTFIEGSEDKVAYTINDLTEVVEKLASNHMRFTNYLSKVGLISPRSYGA